MTNQYHIFVVRYADSYIRLTTIGSQSQSLDYLQKYFAYVEHMIDLPDVISSDTKDDTKEKKGSRELGNNSPNGLDFTILTCKHIHQIRTHRSPYDFLQQQREHLVNIKANMEFRIQQQKERKKRKRKAKRGEVA